MTSNQSASLAPDPAAFRLGVYFLRTVARRVSNGYRWPLRRCQRAPSRIAAAFSGPSRACGRLHFRNIRWRPSAVALHGIKVNHHTLDVRNVLSAGKRGGVTDREAVLASSGAQAGSLRMEGTGPSVE